MSALRRFVFEFTNTGYDLSEGKTIEVRCETAADAIEEVANRSCVCDGAVARLIGERLGLYSATRFLPLVPIEELPWHIIQNDTFTAAHEAARVARFELETGLEVA